MEEPLECQELVDMRYVKEHPYESPDKNIRKVHMYLRPLRQLYKKSYGTFNDRLVKLEVAWSKEKAAWMEAQKEEIAKQALQKDDGMEKVDELITNLLNEETSR